MMKKMLKTMVILVLLNCRIAVANFPARILAENCSKDNQEAVIAVGNIPLTPEQQKYYSIIFELLMLAAHHTTNEKMKKTLKEIAIAPLIY